MFKKMLSALLLFLMTATFCVSSAETDDGFSIRGGIRFGMTPNEIIAIEESNGFYYDLTSSGDILYNAGYSYQLYYEDHELGSVGTLPITRFEYDFDMTTKQMYQFYYVFKTSGAYRYLAPMLTEKYGDPTPSDTLVTEKYSDIGARNHNSQSRWILEYEDQIVVIDLWDNSYDVCFLAYHGFSRGEIMNEKESIDFSI